MNKSSIPFVSVVIPTYNHANYLKKALQSLLDQTYNNWEAIVIDNHSIDNTHQVVKKFKDSRIKYLKINNHGIIAKSRNEGIKNSKGEWIAFLDSDDWWFPDKLKICLKYCNNNVDLIYHDLKIASRNRRLFKRNKIKTRKLTKPVIIDLLVNGNAISNSSVLVRKNLLDKIGLINESKNIVAAEDYNTWLKIAELTNNFLYLPKILGYYLLHEANVSQKNMYYPTRQATYKFLSLLNIKQKIILKTNLKYISARFQYLNCNFKKAKKDLLFVIKKGSIVNKLKSIVMIIYIIVRGILNK